MSSKVPYEFVPTDGGEIVAALVAAYQRITGRHAPFGGPRKAVSPVGGGRDYPGAGLHQLRREPEHPLPGLWRKPGRPERVVFPTSRPQAKPALCTERFTISQAQTTSILVPAGTRVTDMSNVLIWETVEDAYVEIGSTTVDVQVRCQTPGTVGNGYAKGQLDTIVDLFDYYAGCENITESEGGADEATDQEYYQLMRESMDAFSTAGPTGAYVYIAKQVSNQIADVLAVSPSAGNVVVYVLMEDGTIAGTELKNAVLKALSQDTVRPLTDHVSMGDAQTVEYDIAFTYYVPAEETQSGAEVQAAVDAAVQEYVTWQSGKLGRDINPSHLIGLLMQTGIKRVALTSPTYTALQNGDDGSVPQLARVRQITATNGGYESE